MKIAWNTMWFIKRNFIASYGINNWTPWRLAIVYFITRSPWFIWCPMALVWPYWSQVPFWLPLFVWAMNIMQCPFEYHIVKVELNIINHVEPWCNFKHLTLWQWYKTHLSNNRFYKSTCRLSTYYSLYIEIQIYITAHKESSYAMHRIDIYVDIRQ